MHNEKGIISDTYHEIEQGNSRRNYLKKGGRQTMQNDGKNAKKCENAK